MVIPQLLTVIPDMKQAAARLMRIRQKTVDPRNDPLTVALAIIPSEVLYGMTLLETLV